MSGRGPTYLLRIELSTTSNNGKSLLTQSKVVAGKCIGEMIDEVGGVEEGEVRRWFAGLLSEAGMIGAEGQVEGLGLKEE